MAKPGALATLDVDAALDEISNGVIAKQIAARYGVTADAVRQKLYKANPERYRQAVSDQVEHWVFDSADEMNELPADALCIARARARAEFRLKLAGALNPKFAAKQQITQLTVNVTADVGFAAELAAKARTFAPSVPHEVIDADIVVDNQHVIGQSNGLLVMREDNAGDIDVDGDAIDGQADGGGAE